MTLATIDSQCIDGVLTHTLAAPLTTGHITGTDASSSMISTAQTTIPPEYAQHLDYFVLDALEMQNMAIPGAPFTKIFSNAALHWILPSPSPAQPSALATQKKLFKSFYENLYPGGSLVFEMGGLGNVAEVRAALLSAIAKRIGWTEARAADPWFFPDERWAQAVVGGAGFKVERCERVYRSTKMEAGAGGGVEGWVRLMGKRFLEAVEVGERDAVVAEVVECLRGVCDVEGQEGEYLGYVRLRVLARKV